MSGPAFRRGFDAWAATARQAQGTVAQRGRGMGAVLLEETSDAAWYVTAAGHLFVHRARPGYLERCTAAETAALVARLEAQHPWLAGLHVPVSKPEPVIERTSGLINGRWYSDDDPGNPAYADVRPYEPCRACGGTPVTVCTECGAVSSV